MRLALGVDSTCPLPDPPERALGSEAAGILAAQHSSPCSRTAPSAALAFCGCSPSAGVVARLALPARAAISWG